MRQLLAPVAIVLGLGLLATSYWARDAGGAGYWSEADQQAYQQAALAFHKLAHAPPPRTAKTPLRATTDDLETARQRFEVEQRRLEAARRAQRRTGGALFWSGLAAIAVGILAAAVARRT
jgi:hypothetical protein